MRADLSCRVEAATGPDRELDALINDIAGRHPTMPAYTASLDAAITLVPEGWHWALRKMPLGTYLSSQFIIAPNGSDRPYVPDTLVQCEAATPALALTAAALRAIEQQETSRG
jgi:hypothetical protein